MVDKEILGNNDIFPSNSPPDIQTFRHFCPIERIDILVPLHKPLVGHKFRSSITGHPTLSYNLEGGNPGGLKL